jgi:hypothetical protein
MSILFHHYKELKECISIVEGIKRLEPVTINCRDNNKELLTKKEGEKEKKQKNE